MVPGTERDLHLSFPSFYTTNEAWHGEDMTENFYTASDPSHVPHARFWYVCGHQPTLSKCLKGP